MLSGRCAAALQDRGQELCADFRRPPQAGFDSAREPGWVSPYKVTVHVDELAMAPGQFRDNGIDAVQIGPANASIHTQ